MKYILTIVGNKESGSIKLGKVKMFDGLDDIRTRLVSIRLPNEPTVRKVSYVMGSQNTGYRVCCKGTGVFPATEGLIDIELDIIDRT